MRHDSGPCVPVDAAGPVSVGQGVRGAEALHELADLVRRDDLPLAGGEGRVGPQPNPGPRPRRRGKERS